MQKYGPVGRLGRYTATHFRLVAIVWAVVVLRLLGARAWWLPKPLARVLPDVRFGHA